MEGGGSGASDQDSGGEDECSAQDDLDAGDEETGGEIAVADPGDDEEFDGDYDVGEVEGAVDFGDEEGQGVQKAAEESHASGDETAAEGLAAAGERAVVREAF